MAFTASLSQLGRAADARAALEAAITASSSRFKFITASRPAYYCPQGHELLLDGLRKTGWNG